MKIAFIPETSDCWRSGIWFHRISAPATALTERGHHASQFVIGHEFPDEVLDWPDTVIFGRTYYDGFEPAKWMNEYRKRGKRVLYDMDDDFWAVAKSNPSVAVSNALKDQYESQIRACDAVITPSPVLAKKFKKHFKKPVFIAPNGIDLKVYQKPAQRDPAVGDRLVIGYMGGSSHWEDLDIIVGALEELSQKYDFIFAFYGVCGTPIESEMYHYHKYLKANVTPERNSYFKAALDFYGQLQNLKMLHTPFMPPELHPSVLSRMSMDIGLCPLHDTEFNRGKSCIKFYEYAAVGAAVLASDVEPYKREVTYRAKNTKKDWVKKIEKLIVDEQFRKKLAAEQYDWVAKNRNIGGYSDPEKPEIHYPGIGLDWELACQKPGGLKVLNQK